MLGKLPVKSGRERGTPGIKAVFVRGACVGPRGRCVGRVGLRFPLPLMPPDCLPCQRRIDVECCVAGREAPGSSCASAAVAFPGRRAPSRFVDTVESITTCLKANASPLHQKDHGRVPFAGSSNTSPSTARSPTPNCMSSPIPISRSGNEHEPRDVTAP